MASSRRCLRDWTRCCVYLSGVARKPFNPDDAIGGLFEQAEDLKKSVTPQTTSPARPIEDVAPRSKPEKNTPLTPSSLNQRVKDVLEQGIPGPLEVVGELSNLKQQGHWYFSLKDDDSVVSCVMWRSDAGRVGFEPRNGDEVVIKGRISHWQPAGRTQFYASSIRKKGLGNLEERFQALCAELRREGYFDDDRKCRLPSFPRRVAVVTSATGAAIEDVRRTAATRLPCVEFLVIDVRVQGDDAPGQIAEAIRRLDLNAASLGIDAILVTRGGGSREDLWAFNERIVADAAFACRTPLIAAIGHEVDTSVIELIADRRASTPTQAAMFLIPDRGELVGQIQYQEERLRTVIDRSILTGTERIGRAPIELLRVVRARLARALNQVSELDVTLKSNRPGARLASGQGRLSALSERMSLSMQARTRAAAIRLDTLEMRLDQVRRNKARSAAQLLDSLEARLGSVGPRSVLARGFTCTLDDEGRLVRSVSDLKIGTRATTILSDGRVVSKVESLENQSEAHASDLDDSSSQE